MLALLFEPLVPFLAAVSSSRTKGKEHSGRTLQAKMKPYLGYKVMI